MARRNRYDIAAVPVAALGRFPAWLIAYDEEAEKGQSEGTIKPNEVGDAHLPGFRVADVRGADGTTALALVGGDLGVASMEDLDEVWLYLGGRSWCFSLGAETCTQDDPGDLLSRVRPSFFPFTVATRPVDLYEQPVDRIVFSVGAGGELTPGA